MNKRKFSKKLIYLILLVLIVVVTGIRNKNTDEEQPPAAEQSSIFSIEENKLNIFYIDVGQGDSQLIVFPDGETMLIDAGPTDSGEKVCDFLERLNIKTLNYVIATHPHEDHTGGMARVLQSLEAESFYMPEVSAKTKCFQNMLTALSESGLKAQKAKSGVTVKETDDLKAEIISPASAEYNELNNYSAVLKLTYKEKTFLFQGDAEKEAEYEILDNHYVKADVLKAGHHGSSTSSVSAYLKAVKPDYAVISVARYNDYGHPHDEIVERMNKNNIEILRTDEKGTIKAVSDGFEIKFDFEK